MSDHLPALFRLGDEGDGVRAIRERLRRPATCRRPSRCTTWPRAEPCRSRTTRSGTTTRCVARSAPSSSGAGSSPTASSARRPTSSSTAPAGASATGCCRTPPATCMQGDDVATLQERLLALGFSPERVDGLFGPNTEQAVRGFQRGVGLAPDGVVGPETLRAFADLQPLRHRRLARTPCASASWCAGPGTAWPAAPSCSTPATAATTPGAQAGTACVEADLDARPRPPDRGAPVRDRGDGRSSPAPARPAPDDLERAAFANDAGADVAAVAALRLRRPAAGQRRGDLLLRAGPVRRLVGGRRAAGRPGAARDRRPHRAGRLPLARPRLDPAAAHPDAGGADRGRLPQPRPRTPRCWPSRSSATRSPRPSSWPCSASTSARTTPTPPARSTWVTCGPTWRPGPADRPRGHGWALPPWTSSPARPARRGARTSPAAARARGVVRPALRLWPACQHGLTHLLQQPLDRGLHVLPPRQRGAQVEPHPRPHRVLTHRLEADLGQERRWQHAPAELQRNRRPSGRTPPSRGRCAGAGPWPPPAPASGRARCPACSGATAAVISRTASPDTGAVGKPAARGTRYAGA